MSELFRPPKGGGGGRKNPPQTTKVVKLAMGWYCKNNGSSRLLNEKFCCELEVDKDTRMK
jgi:hypothetical protein